MYGLDPVKKNRKYSRSKSMPILCSHPMVGAGPLTQFPRYWLDDRKLTSTFGSQWRVLVLANADEH
jgi:hypothetical protein